MIPQRVAPVFAVSDLTASVKHYEEALGFSQDFKIGTYAGVRLGAVGIHLTEAKDRPVHRSIAYVFCDEVDSFFSDLKSRGATFRYELSDAPYGMREFIVLDPDGNQISFGCDIEKD